MSVKESSKLFDTIASFQESSPPDAFQLDKVLLDLDAFQETPQLLDSRLPGSVERLAREYDCVATGDRSWAAHLLYALAKTRGAKVIARFFPSDVKYLLKILKALETTQNTWQDRYVLLLWLAVTILAPFPLTSFGQETAQRVMDVANKYLGSPGKERDAAALVAARFLARPDAGPWLEAFAKSWESATDYSTRLLGTLATAARLFKLLDPHTVYNLFCKSGLTLLLDTDPPKDLAGGTVYERVVVKCLSRIGVALISIDDDGESPAELLDRLVEALFMRLSNPNVLVRHAAAKSIAVISTALPQDLQPDMVIAALDYFVIPQTEAQMDAVDTAAWHGHLLLLAELVRRRIEVPDWPRVQEVVEFSLRFTQLRLTRVEGAGVRDAACFVAWSLFRSQQFVPQAQNLAGCLVYAACTDSEIGIRRAASAALQEGVGRLAAGAIVGGLEVVQTVDFFALASVERAYLEVLPKAYDLGYPQLLDYLLEHGIASHAIHLRRLAARAIAILAKTYASGRLEETVQKLLAQAPSPSRYPARFHGVYYALAELCASGCLTDAQWDRTASLSLAVLGRDNFVSAPETAEAFVHLAWAQALAGRTPFSPHTLDMLLCSLATSVPAAQVEIPETSQEWSVIARAMKGGAPQEWTEAAREELEAARVSAGAGSRTVVPLNTVLVLGWTVPLSDATFNVLYEAATRARVFEARRVAIKSLSNSLFSQHNKAPDATDATDATDFTDASNTADAPDARVVRLLLMGMTDFTRRPGQGDVGWTLRRDSLAACAQLCKESLLTAVQRRAYVLGLLRLAGEVRADLRLTAMLRLAQTELGNAPVFEAAASLVPEFTRDEQVYEYYTAHATELVVALEAYDEQPGQNKSPRFAVCAFLKGLVCAAGAQYAAADTLASSFSAFAAILRLRPRLWESVIFPLLGAPTASGTTVRVDERVVLAALRVFARAVDANLPGLPAPLLYRVAIAGTSARSGAHAGDSSAAGITEIAGMSPVRAPFVATVLAGAARGGDARGLRGLLDVCGGAASGGVRQSVGDLLYEVVSEIMDENEEEDEVEDENEDENEVLEKELDQDWKKQINEEMLESLGEIDWTLEPSIVKSKLQSMYSILPLSCP
ncbi:uncharacterized protein SAPINGB_P000670 [Magnusiomyces paraingens]|uniref:Tubulin-folding cofactor D ARM repeats domain-containing protein n=1 Tax=Magnusiomyces paraingens TaxID=2606893 RepID=A0A5E8B1Q3_9ASCO|nr:uncharacterized protein SAPINGB_P000670 [Saprochaete ingens]VVT45198.1 unnamed protein product [Saprochaete ingens]